MEFITLVGNLGAEPQTKTSPSGSFVTFPLYVSKYRQGKKRATVYQVAVFNSDKNFCAARLRKGSKVFVAGDQDVVTTEAKRTFLNVTAKEVVALKPFTNMRAASAREQ